MGWVEASAPGGDTLRILCESEQDPVPRIESLPEGTPWWRLRRPDAQMSSPTSTRIRAAIPHIEGGERSGRDRAYETRVSCMGDRAGAAMFAAVRTGQSGG